MSHSQGQAVESQAVDRSSVIQQVHDFADVYLGFVYRLASKQYEDDYQTMRKMLAYAHHHEEDDERSRRRPSEVDPQVKTSKHTPRAPEVNEYRSEKHQHSKMKHKRDDKDTFLTDVVKKENKLNEQFSDKDSRKPSFKISSNYGYQIERNYRNIEEDRMSSQHRNDIKKPSFKSPVPRLVESNKKAEAEMMLKIANSKKNQLKTQLYEVESDIRRLKNIIIKPRGQAISVAPPPRYMPPKDHSYSRDMPVVDNRRGKEPSYDSFREQPRSEISRRHHIQDETPPLDYYDPYDTPIEPLTDDNAAFVRKLNQEKKEREVTL